MPTYYRTDQAAIHLQVDGVVGLDNVVWDTMSGGDVTTEGTVNYAPGGMSPAVALGGIPKRSNMTLTRVWSDALIGVFKQLDAVCGRGSGRSSYSNLDQFGGFVSGSTISYSGVVIGVSRPDADSDSTAVAKLQVVLDLNRSIS